MISWEWPSGDGPENVVDNYEVVIMPRPLFPSHFTLIHFTYLRVIMNLNVKYEVMVTAINCAGRSNTLVKGNIKFGMRTFFYLLFDKKVRYRYYPHMVEYVASKDKISSNNEK